MGGRRHVGARWKRILGVLEIKSRARPAALRERRIEGLRHCRRLISFELQPPGLKRVWVGLVPRTWGIEDLGPRRACN